MCRPAVGPRPGRTRRCAPTRNNRFRRENDTSGFGTRPYVEKPGCGKAFPLLTFPDISAMIGTIIQREGSAVQNYRLTLCYDGTRYNGWQRQGNTPDTIQGKL